MASVQNGGNSFKIQVPRGLPCEQAFLKIAVPGLLCQLFCRPAHNWLAELSALNQKQAPADGGREEALPTPVGPPAVNQPQNAYEIWKYCSTACFLYSTLHHRGHSTSIQLSYLIIQLRFLPEHTFTVINFTTDHRYTFAVYLLQT